MSIRSLNRYYAPYTIHFQSEKLLWKAHTKLNGKELQYYYRPISLDSYIKREILNDNAYGLSQELIDYSHILDLGGHIGLFSLLCSQFDHTTINSFEPDPRNRRIFDLNLALNDINNIISFPYAINGFQEPETEMYFYPNSGNNTCIPFPFDGSIKKKVINVDINTFLPCDILKIDIEGAEYDVVDSIQDMNLIHKALTIEVHYHVPEWKSRLHNLIKKLTDNNFNVEWKNKYSYNGHIFAKRRN